jgi:hypothetical protein
MNEEQFRLFLEKLQALTAEIAGLRADLAERAEQPVAVVIVQPEPEPPQPIRAGVRKRRQRGSND